MYLISISLDLLCNLLQLLLSTSTANSTIFFIFFSTFIGPASARSYTIVVVGNWLVGNSETALRIFLIFYMKLGDYKGRKVTEPDFWKKNLIWRYSQKGLQISPKSDTLIFFPKTALTIFLVCGLKLVINDLEFEWNLFFRKICNLEISDLEIVIKLPKLRFFTIFSTLHH